MVNVKTSALIHHSAFIIHHSPLCCESPARHTRDRAGPSIPFAIGGGFGDHRCPTDEVIATRLTQARRKDFRGMRLLTIFAACLAAAAASVSCSKSNNVLLGRVEAKVGSHAVVVTDCYRTEAPAPQKVEGAQDGARETYRFTPCRDADILIRDEELSVNGTRYGRLRPGDSVTVDHGKVFVNDREPRAAG
jgi:hypothetical protein